jgi:AcrR family transcriptional regulator
MRNAVPAALEPRWQTYLDEIQRLVDAAGALMRRTGEVDPPVSAIVREAGLSNQAFYRHFPSKDALLLAMLEDGVERLLAYLEHRMARAPDPLDRVRRWVDGVMAQAVDTAAAEATRPFALNGDRLAGRFPDESARTAERLRAPLVDAVAEARRTGVAPSADPARDAEAIYHLAIGRMHAHLVARTRPSRRDRTHLAEFAVAAVTRGGAA